MHHQMIPRSLYIHIPWCIQKCPYCDFNSHKTPNKMPESEYIDQLIADFRHDINQFPNQSIHSIFIGGGTPSLFSAQSFEKLFDAIQQHTTFESDIEITLEANPGTIDQPRFKDYRSIGINRLSLGIQSFNPKHLQKLGRIHDDKQAHRAISAARNAGFDNINLDIMHGLPKQTVAEGLNDLSLALSHEPEHLSWYQLTIEPNTVFYSKKPTLPSENTISELESQGLQILEKAGLNRYEISAFCKPNHASKHNMNYWLFGDYMGIGAGAHGKITQPHQIIRTQKTRQPNLYIQDTNHKTMNVEPADQLFELMLNATRLQQPIPFELLTERTHMSLEDAMPLFEKAQQMKLIQIVDQQWQVTDFGRQFTNNLQALFLP